MVSGSLLRRRAYVRLGERERIRNPGWRGGSDRVRRDRATPPTCMSVLRRVCCHGRRQRCSDNNVLGSRRHGRMSTRWKGPPQTTDPCSKSIASRHWHPRLVSSSIHSTSLFSPLAVLVRPAPCHPHPPVVSLTYLPPPPSLPFPSPPRPPLHRRRQPPNECIHHPVTRPQAVSGTRKRSGGLPPGIELNSQDKLADARVPLLAGSFTSSTTIF